MEKILFETEKEAIEFIEESGIIELSNCEDVLLKFKDNGYIKDSLIERAEEEYNKYKYKNKNFISRSDVDRCLKENEKLADILYSAIQYLKKKLECIKIPEFLPDEVVEVPEDEEK